MGGTWGGRSLRVRDCLDAGERIGAWMCVMRQVELVPLRIDSSGRA